MIITLKITKILTGGIDDDVYIFITNDKEEEIVYVRTILLDYFYPDFCM